MFDFEQYISDAIQSAALAVQWQASDATDEGRGYPLSEEGDEYTDDVARIIYDQVEDFIRANAFLLGRSKISAPEAGHNLVLSANGHGTGFWDRGFEDGEELHKQTEPYSFDAEFALDPDDGEVVYLMVDNIVIVDLPGFTEE